MSAMSLLQASTIRRPKQAEHCHQREIIPIVRFAGGAQQCLELQLRQSQGW
jgi:hypothetical protein